MASVSGAAEALYVAHTIRTAGACQTRVVLRMDSSSARALLFKQGVSRVRHLGTKLLWLQDYTKRKLLEPAAVNTLHNTSVFCSSTSVKSLQKAKFAMASITHTSRKPTNGSQGDNQPEPSSSRKDLPLPKGVKTTVPLTVRQVRMRC